MLTLPVFKLPPSVCLSLSLSLSLSGSRFPNRRRVPLCCTEVSSTDLSADVTGEPTIQHAHGPCVKALIFRTDKGKVCVDPKAAWTKDCELLIITGTNTHTDMRAVTGHKSINSPSIKKN
uniref:Chemokine interleukin-8-like domain-containing protein n=1 Tax=Seriola dumerili TaxID=41447 RepID=A0A3B4TCE0_SERDU